MKIKNGFVVRKITDSYMAVPVGKRTADVPGLVALSESGALLWDFLKEERTEEDLADLLLQNYEVEEEQARKDVRDFLNFISEQGWLDE